MNTAKLRAEGASLKANIKAASERLKEIETELLKDGPQKYEECTVVGESTQVIVPEGDDDEAVQKFAGEHYDKLFERVTSYKCVKGYKDVVTALFPTRTAAAILNRCTKTKSGFVKWN